jgi:hypothetical protein
MPSKEKAAPQGGFHHSPSSVQEDTLLGFSSVTVKVRTNKKSSGLGLIWVSWRRALERGLGLPKRNGTRQRSRTCPNGMAVVAALHDPLTILVADDLADVMTPDDDGPD